MSDTITQSSDEVLGILRERGLRMTPQRRAIVAEIMLAQGHINPAAITRRVQAQMPGVNASTVYRTLSLLEEAGVVSHAHLESGPEYHRADEGHHVHLVCSNCGSDETLSLDEAEQMASMIRSHHQFEPDLSHFAISGRCAKCT